MRSRGWRDKGGRKTAAEIKPFLTRINIYIRGFYCHPGNRRDCFASCSPCDKHIRSGIKSSSCWALRWGNGHVWEGAFKVEYQISTKYIHIYIRITVPEAEVFSKSVQSVIRIPALWVMRCIRWYPFDLFWLTVRTVYSSSSGWSQEITWSVLKYMKLLKDKRGSDADTDSQTAQFMQHNCCIRPSSPVSSGLTKQLASLRLCRSVSVEWRWWWERRSR